MGREGTGLQMKNHEGYHDPTAGKAIRRAHQSKRRARGSGMRHPLTYRLGELPGVHISASFWQNKQRGCRIQKPIR